MAPELGLTALAEVKRVIDGDTLDVELRIPVRVRLLDCWAPERRTPAGVASTQQLQRMAPAGGLVVVHVPTQGADSVQDVFTFGRVLANVWPEGADESVSQAMVATGHATERKRD